MLLFGRAAADHAPLEHTLREAGLHAELHPTASPPALAEAAAARVADVIVAYLDEEAPVRELARVAHASDPLVPIVVAAAAPRVAALIRAGARDAVPAADGEHLAAVVAREAAATRRARDAAAMERRLAQLEAIVEHVPVMLFSKEARSLKLELWNKEAEGLTGVPRAHMIGKTDQDLFPEQAHLYNKVDREVLANKVPVTAEEPISSARGERWLYTRKVPVLGADGEPISLLGISLDITDRRDAERSLVESNRKLEESERAKAELIARLRYSIDELSNPILEVWDDVLAMPVIGVVDSRRASDMVQRLLAEVTRTQASFVILDLTGVEVVDTKTADHLVKLIRKVEVVGARCVLTGIRPAVAETLVDIGVDFGHLETLRNLKHGLREALRAARRTRSDLRDVDAVDDAEPEAQPKKPRAR